MNNKRAAVLLRQPNDAASGLGDGREVKLGYIDFFGYSSAAGGWLFNGWVPRPPDLDQSEPVTLSVHYSQSTASGEATLAFYRREDLDHNAVGVIVMLPGNSTRAVGPLQLISFRIDQQEYQARTGDFTNRLSDPEVVEPVRLNLLHQALGGRSRDHLLALTARRGFCGQDTLSSLSEPVMMEIDEAVFCPPGGVLLKGWLLAAAGVVRHLRVRCGPLAGEVARDCAIRVERPDVLAAVGAEHGFTDLHCGFAAYVPGAVLKDEPTYLEIELASGEVGFKPLKLSKRAGIDAIRQILTGIDIRHGDIDSIFDATLGPAIASLNTARLRNVPAVEELRFGPAPGQPLCTLIVPLFGRVDFLEYQMAIFSQQADQTPVEIIYVLDDPSKRRELSTLARSVFERFEIPFRVLLLQENLGFAPANNLGLQAAKGQFVCFLNSDVFPISCGWIRSLTEGLHENPDLAIIGARLLFEDGSIQHEGCEYNPVAEFGNWQFIDHINKGRRPMEASGIIRRPAVTGACMMMRRSQAEELGGFDEAFIIGDFEDSDLCLKAQVRGLGCAVHTQVELYHLERKSQAPPSEDWRMNLTLYNAWVHQRRWFSGEKPAE
jgi:GT2 family glycosyltransferase